MLSQREMLTLAAMNDQALEITRMGSGPPLLFLHDGDGVEDNDDVLAPLAEHFTVIAPSHPGFGASSLPRSFRSVGDLAYHYLDLLKQLELRDVLLVGASFGGWIAAELAIRSVDRVAGLVLIDALGPKFDGPDGEQIRDIFTFTHRDVRSVLRNDQKPDERDMSSDPVDVVTRRVRNRETLTLFGWSPLLHNPQLRQWLHRIRIPAMVIWGENDRVVPVEYGRAFAAEIPGATLEIVRDAGHYSHRDQPRIVADKIISFSTRRER